MRLVFHIHIHICITCHQKYSYGDDKIYYVGHNNGNLDDGHDYGYDKDNKDNDNSIYFHEDNDGQS